MELIIWVVAAAGSEQLSVCVSSLENMLTVTPDLATSRGFRAVDAQAGGKLFYSRQIPGWDHHSAHTPCIVLEPTSPSQLSQNAQSNVTRAMNMQTAANA